MTAEPLDVDMRVSAEDDPVVSELPVYLNRMHDPPFMCGEIYALLNSLRPADRSYGDQGEMRSVELDDARRRVRINYSVSSVSGDYDDNSTYSLSEHALIGIPRDSTSATYCMGVLGETGLTLVPITAVCAMRPGFAHVDAEVALRKGPVEEEAPRSLTGKALYYQDLARSLRRSDAAWRSLDFYAVSSPEASDLFDQYITPSTDHCVSFERSFSTEEYLVELATASASPDAAASAVSRLDFGRQVETIMKQVCAVRFSDFVLMLPPNTRAKHSETDILNKLELVSIMVNGVWILHSNLTTHRPHLWDTRDALLLLLHAGRDITVQTLSAIAQLGREEIEEILLPICQLDILSNTWKLKVKSDEQFVRAWPQIARQQDAAIAALIAKLKRAKMTRGVDKHVMDVRPILIDSGALTTEEVRAALQTGSRDHFVSEAAALEALRAAGAVPLRERWVLPDRTGVPGMDAFRVALMDLFQTRDTIDAKDMPTGFAGAELRRLVKEFANPGPNGTWVFKGDSIAPKLESS